LQRSLAAVAGVDAPPRFEVKRRLVETLVESTTVDTIEEAGVKEVHVRVVYRFCGITARTEADAASLLSLHRNKKMPRLN
jgi:hypothetical protein